MLLMLVAKMLKRICTWLGGADKLTGMSNLSALCITAAPVGVILFCIMWG